MIEAALISRDFISGILDKSFSVQNTGIFSLDDTTPETHGGASIQGNMIINKLSRKPLSQNV